MSDTTETNDNELDESWYPTSTQELHELLTFYRKQAIIFKKERCEYEKILKSLEMTNEEKHKLEWKLHEKSELNEDFKKQLSDIHILLYKEKNLNIELNSEIKSLRAEINELSQNKKHLLSLLECANNNINQIVETDKLHKRCKPCHYNKKRIICNKIKTENNRQKLTTIYLPSENTMTFTEKLKAKEKELQDLKKQTFEINEYLMNDRNKAFESLENLRNEYNEKFKNLQNEICDLSQQHLYNLKEYLNYKRNTKQEIEKLKFNFLEMKQEKNKIKSKYENKFENVKKTRNKMEKKLKKESTKIINGFRMETMRKHQELNNVKDELLSLTKSYQFDMKNLKTKLNKTKRKNKKLNQINKCHKIGIKTDIHSLKQRLNKLQKSMNNLCIDNNSENTQYHISLQNEINKVKNRLLELAKITEQ